MKNDILIFEESDINQIIISKIYIGYDRINNSFNTQDIKAILYNDGMVIREDAIKTPYFGEIISIESHPRIDDNISIITNKKECYQKVGNLFQFITSFNIIQRFKYYCLTDKGEVYVKKDEDLEIPDDIKPDAFGELGQIINGDFNKLEYLEYYKIQGLPYIVQLTTKNYVLSKDGNIWYFNYNDLTAYRDDKYYNIIQIYESMKNDYYLDNKGNIFTPNIEIKTNENLIEIAVDSDEKLIYALDNKMNLFIYHISGKLLKNYDLKIMIY